MAWYNPSTWAPVDALQDLANDKLKSNVATQSIRSPFSAPPQSQPAQPSQPLNADTPAPQAPAQTWTGYGSGGGGGGAASVSADDLAALDYNQSELQRQLSRTDNTLRQALDRVLNEYNKELSGANLTRSRNLEDFNTKTQISEQGRSRELGKVDTGARMLANSLRQKIGLASGSGSSAYQITAPGAVARDASDKRTDVLQDYSANFNRLDTDKKRSEQDFASLLEELNAQKLAREGGVQGDIAEQRNQINAKLAQVAAERASRQGQGFAGARAAMAPFEAAIRQGESVLDSIFDKYTTKYNVKPLQVNNTQLNDYAVDKTAVRDNQATGNQNPYAPFRNFARDDEENPLA